MFNKYRLITMTRNIEDGETTFKEELDTEKKAMDKYYTNCDTYGTNPSVKACEVILFNPNGDIMKIEKIDNAKYMPTPEPETVESSEE